MREFLSKTPDLIALRPEDCAEFGETVLLRFRGIDNCSLRNSFHAPLQLAAALPSQCAFNVKRKRNLSRR